MTTAQILEKMIVFSEGNLHDIDHLIRVWTYAKTIGELEGLDSRTQYILETAAITHDIACPYCRTKYGNTEGRHQEEEGAWIVRDFLRGTGMDEAAAGRVIYLVSHHHTIRFCWRRTISRMRRRITGRRRMCAVFSRRSRGRGAESG